MEVYRNSREQLQDMFESNHTSTRHALPNMEQTFQKLSSYMKAKRTSSYIPGRSARYEIPDAMAVGMHILMTSDVEKMDIEDEEAVEVEGSTVDDELEVEDRGDLLAE